MDYDWPGNVRELENEIHRLASIGDGSLNPKYLSRHIVDQSSLADTPADFAGLNLAEMEESLIGTALRRARGNKSQAARLLGIPRTSLNNKIRRYGLLYDRTSP
jgi:DNA-binding NtrC family response regulator